MFKATLIENQKYYKLRSKHLLYILLPSLAIGLLVNFYSMPLWISISAIIFLIGITLLASRNQKSINKLANKQIEIDIDKIQIKGIDGKIIETINIETKNVIKIKANYKMAQETMSDIKEELMGNSEKHFLIIEKDKIERRFDFEFNSYYMQTQLSKLIEKWQKGDYTIQYQDPTHSSL